ncbi:NCS2 family permease [Cerasicoccus arenae]|uniref:Adenine permease n=1 Tax=Cerasicoccus arenae TaxID=424488 RepID=A0A8J3GES6_9BACT|nr:NCS2 family permease [Cerasicoccus arenae]MBK1857830.1 NCS2 family permease [Cerasicoccus arenae]GHC11623.1 adenine permease [Cerasicoccus arenae]
MLQRCFKLRAEGTTAGREVLAGLTTFAAMAYIIVVNPIILHDGGKTGLELAGLISVTALAAALGCFLMAMLTNYPIAQAPGMGLNSYFASIVVVGMGVPWQGALAMVFWNGLIFFLLSISGVRAAIIRALPNCLQIGVQCGIGFFIAFIGLKNADIIVANPYTLVAEGDLLQAVPLMVLGGLLLITVLTVRRIPGAIIGTILVVSVIGLFIPNGDKMITAMPDGIVGLPASISQTFLGLDWFYPFRNWQTAMPIIATLLILDMFDSLGTLIALGRQSGLMDDKGEMPRLNRALTADALATVGGALLGTSTTTSFIESATGIESGGRTGLTSVVVGCCFLLALFFTPILTVVPAAATAPALIMVGLFMAQGLKHINYSDLHEVAPAILTALLIPLTFSITHGIMAGLIFYCALMLLTGRAKGVSAGAWVIAAVFVGFAFI